MMRASPDEPARWSSGGALASYRDLPAARDEQRPQNRASPDRSSNIAIRVYSAALSK